MAITSGFFNSIDGDRKYDAEQLGSIFEGVIKDGVYKDVGDAFAVTATTGTSVRVGTGRGWFRNTWIKNDKPINLTLTPSDSVLPRYDYIVIRNDRSVGGRKNSIVILQGNPSTSPKAPTLTDSTTVKDYPIARVYRLGGSEHITPDNILSLVGSSQTPWVTSVLENVSVSNLYSQWEAEFDEWLSDANDINVQESNTFRTWRSEQMDEFVSWKNSVHAVLTEDVAGNLTAEIEQLKAQEKTAYSIFDGIPEMHGQIFRGKNLGSSYTTAQKTAVRNGSFTDLWLGDYWEIGGKRYRIADFNYFMNTTNHPGTPPLTTNHIIVVPDQSHAQESYALSDTASSYQNSHIKNRLITVHRPPILSAFSDSSLLTISHNLLSDISEGGTPQSIRLSSKIELMTAEHVFGMAPYDARNAPQPTRQFSLFRVAPRYIILDAGAGYRWYHLQNISSETRYPYYVQESGELRRDRTATTGKGVRPFFALRG